MIFRLYILSTKYFKYLVFLFVMHSCAATSDFSNIPFINISSLSKNEMRQGINYQDSLSIVLFFTDGDGDIGAEKNDNSSNIFITDLRTGALYSQYKAPAIPKEGASNGVSGTITINLYTSCCIYPISSGLLPCERSQIIPTNELQLEIYIVDRAGNKSNVVTTDKLTLRCDL